MALMGALVDNFRANTLDTAKWDAVNSAGNSGQQEGGRYTFIVQSGATGDAALVSDAAYNLTGSHIHIHLIDAGVQEAGLEMYPLILTQNPANNDDALLIVVTNNLVGIYEFVGGVGTGLAFPAYNSTSMQWWRIREAGGTVYFESAPAVQGPWTVQASVVPTIAITALYAKIRTFDFLALSTAKSTAITDVNYLQPPDLDFPNGTFPVGLEMAFGADLSESGYDWAWTNVTPDFLAQDFAIRRGRSDEQARASATETKYVLDNPAGDYTPDDARSIYWPNIDLGTPGRLWLNVSTPRLLLHPTYGSNATVASTSALDLTADLDVRVDMHLKTFHPDGWNAVIVGRADNSGPYSWRLEVRPDHTVTIFWSSTGTAPANELTATIPVLPMSARATLRVTLDVNNGAGGKTAKFYLGTGGVNGSFTQIGPDVTSAGTTSISNAAADLIVGSPPEISGVFALDADIYRVQVRNGIGGTAIVDADFTAQVSGVTSFVDSTGLLWTVNGAAELSNKWYRITGTNDEWEPNWPWGDLSNQQPGGLDEGEARVDITLSGVIRRITQGASPLSSPLFRAVSAQSTIQSYHPMEDEDDATSLASGIPGKPAGSWTGSLDLASYDGIPGSKSIATLGSNTRIAGPIVGTFTGHWQVDWYVNVPSGPASPTSIMNVIGEPGATIALWVVNISSGAITVQGRDMGGTTITTNTTTPTGFFTGPQHLRLMAKQNGTNIDWQLVWFPVVIPFASGFFFTGSIAGTLGGISGWGIPPDANASGIALGQVSSFDAFDLASGDSAAIGWAGDTAVARMARLCSEQGVTFRVIGAASGSAKMGVQGIDTFPALLYAAEDADGGILYDMPDNLGLIYRTRESLYNQPPNVVLDGLQSQFANPLTPVLDDARLRNDVTVQRQGGSSFQATDSTSVAKRGLYDESVTLNLYLDTQLQGAAGWRLHAGTWPGMRFPEASTNLGVAPEIIDSWLTVDPGSRVQLINLPPQHPTAGVELMVEGWQEPISPEDWFPRMNCSPAGVWDVAELDGDWVPDEYLLRLDTDGSVLAIAIDDNDTALFVGVTDGPLWTDDNAETPFDILVGGERMTVTDIDAAAGSSEFVGAGDAEDVTPTTSFVAPSVVASAVGDLLICGWINFNAIDTYTLPGSMTIAASTDGTYTTFEDATEVLAASGATGTRTAVFGTSDTWSAISLVAHAASGTPGIQEFLSSVTTDAGGAAPPLTITTVLPAAVGDWLLAIQAWDWDPGNNMGAPSGSGWQVVADSVLANANVSRIRAWARPVTTAGIQSVTYDTVTGIDDNHARLYVLTGVTGITQEFTVTRSVNDVVRSWPIGTDVRLWFTPVLAR